MPTSPVLTTNRALGLLGEKPITDLTDDSVRATLAAAEYEPLVAELFEGHDWNFGSTRVASLAQLATPPSWGFVYAFQLPFDCVRVRATSLDRIEGGGGEPWEVEGLTLVCNVSTVSLRYTRRVLEGQWRPAFATAVAYELAARLAYPLARSASLAELYAKVALHRLALAKALDGQEGAPRRYVTDALTRDRA